MLGWKLVVNKAVAWVETWVDCWDLGLVGMWVDCCDWGVVGMWVDCLDLGLAVKWAVERVE